MQGGTPLRVLHVSLSAGQVACLPTVDHHHLRASRFEHTIERQPVDPGSFHCYGVDTFSQQPIAQVMQLAGKRAYVRCPRHRRLPENREPVTPSSLAPFWICKFQKTTEFTCKPGNA